MGMKVTRRRFLKQAAVGLAVPMIFPKLSLANSPNGRLQHASVGVGGMMGGADMNSIINSGKVDIVAICDVDSNHLAKAAALVPQARQYRDWREMLEKEAGKIDSVNVSTPDHMHAPIALSAINLGKHVYCQKPLTRTVHEARRLTDAAQKHSVVTQMGIQIHSEIAYRLAVRLVQEGALGKIQQWHSWQGPGSWPVGGRPEGSDPVPETLKWDLWLGVAPERPYKEKIYHPVQWRGWQDFGSGVMGDFACHIFDPVFGAIEPGRLLSVQAKSAEMNSETWPVWREVEYEFVGSKFTADKTIKGIWYDGGKMPPADLVQLPEGRSMPGGGSLIIGEEGFMVLPHVGGPQLYPLEKYKGYPKPKLEPQDHYGQWVNACLGEGEATANFSYSGPMTEAVQLGNIAVRFPGQKLIWDTAKLQVTNVAEANKHVHRKYRKGWEVEGMS